MVSSSGLQQTSRRVIVRPVVVFAAKCLGPGRLRLGMVKLAHELGGGDNYFELFYGRPRRAPRSAFEAPAIPQAHQRAA
ncbi:MAG: hypothetical protein NVS1B3_11770 [Candidatus Dormibacteraceae bacterium]